MRYTNKETSTKMKIYTSYFGNIKRLGIEKIVPIGVALYTPKWYNGPELKLLAPRGYMLAKGISEQQYTQMYVGQVLSALNPSAVVRQIEQLAGGRDCVLLCYEKPGDFCHRHIIADWLNHHLNLGIEEFKVQAEPPKPKVVQMSLF